MHAYLFFALLLCAHTTHAAIYRCQSPTGLTFQEQPCPENSVGSEIEVEDYKIGSRAVPAPKSKRKTTKKRKRRRSTAANNSNRRRCFTKKQQIDKIRWQMRRGYKSGQGVKLRQRRRALEEYMREFCR